MQLRAEPPDAGVPVKQMKGDEEMTGTVARGAIVMACMLGLVLAGCGNKKNGGDEDATDTAGGDPAADGTLDPIPDGQPDPTPEPSPEVVEDGTPDAEEDAEEDTEEDVEEDASMDPPDDWPTDLPADWPVESSHACIALAERRQCPAAKPARDDPHSFRSGFRSAVASAITAGSGDLPASIRRLPTM